MSVTAHSTVIKPIENPALDVAADTSSNTGVGSTPELSGFLNLRFRTSEGVDGSPTVVDTLSQNPPLRMVRAFSQSDDSALVHLHNISGGVLGGDQLAVTAHVGPGARAQVTTTGATRVYRHRTGLPDAQQLTHFSVAAGGLLEYLPDPLIPFAGSRYRQRTRFELDENAGLFAWELVTPGREASGELFDYEHLEIESRITVQGEPIAFEKMCIVPSLRSPSSPLELGRYRSFATLLVCRAGHPSASWRLLEKELTALAAEWSVEGETVWGVSTLVADGLIVRGLAREGRNLASSLPHFWRRAKVEIYDLEAILPRKIY